MKEPLASVLVCDADTLGGAPRFRGTRVPAKILFDYVLGGRSLDEFLDDYPEVTRADAEAVLTWERERVDKELTGDVA